MIRIKVLEKDNIIKSLSIKGHAKYDEYGGYNTIQAAMGYIKVENFDGYVSELRKWKAVIHLFL